MPAHLCRFHAPGKRRLPTSCLPLLVACSSASLLLAGCKAGGDDAPPPGPPSVGYVTLTAGPVPVATELSGRTVATTSADVRPQADGIIMSQLFQEGTRVRAGQPLYQIDPRPYRASRDVAAASLESAQVNLSLAQAQADRYRSLEPGDAVSRQQFDNVIAAARQARANVRQSRALLAAAQVNLDYTRVVAPISGWISRSSVSQGALVTANQPVALASIQQLDPIDVDLTQSSDALLALRRSLARGTVLPSKANVRLKFQDGSEYPHVGTVEFAEVIVSQTSGTVTLRAVFPNPDGTLLPGMFVRVSVDQAIAPNAILAPQQGITRNPKGEAVALVVGAGDKVEQRIVQTNQTVGNSWLVTGGLKQGDKLIVSGSANAVPGQVVKPFAVTGTPKPPSPSSR